MRAKLEKYTTPGGQKVALASHFLKEVGKKNHNVGEHVSLWNDSLAEDGCEVRLEKLRFKAGSKPWVGTRAVYKRVYSFL